MPLTGWLLDHEPNHNRDVLFFGLVAMIIGLAWLGLIRSFSSLLANMLFVGLAYAAVTTGSVALMTHAFFDKDRPSIFAALNLGFVAVGIGAWLGSSIIGPLERWWGYRQALLYLSVVC